MTLEQMKELAEKRFQLITGEFEVANSGYNRIMEIKQESYIEGLQTGIEMSRWIPCTERPPTKEDADKYNKVFVYDVLDAAVSIIHFNTVKMYDGITHWQPLPKSPTK